MWWCCQWSRAGLYKQRVYHKSSTKELTETGCAVRTEFEVYTAIIITSRTLAFDVVQIGETLGIVRQENWALEG